MFNWLETMRNVITETQAKDEENNEECGLRNEMDYWKHRYYKLNSIDEQLKSPHNMIVSKLLEFCINLSTHLNQERIDKTIRENLKPISSAKNEFEDKQKDFKDLENDLNRFLTEAKNNDKYLSQLER
jgi:predicted RNase H-like nuclease (RuvC/YqgF family)